MSGFEGVVVGLAICPRCKSEVTPLRGPDGKALCPACNNTGILPQGWAPAQPAAWGQPSTPLAPGQPAPTADGAVLSLVMGILALVIPYIGFIFAFIGLSAAKKALQAVAASGGRLQGDGMAKAGRIMAIISLVLYGVVLLVVLAAVVFVLVSNLSKEPAQVAFLASA